VTLAARQLGLPAALVARTHARTLAAEAAGALARLAAPEDPEALHDARVALRRLRSWLRAFEAEAGVPNGIARRLRRLARSTGAARDLEVAVERLAELARRSRGERRAALERLARELARRRDAGRPALVAEASKRWRVLQRPLERALRADPVEIAPRFATLVAGRVAATSAPFRRPPPPARDWPALHQLRIAGKRVRYLLEPLRDAAPSSLRALKALKELQEHLGAVNDAVVLEELLIEHAAELAREAVRGVGAPAAPTAAASRTLRDVSLAVVAVRAWRTRLAREHRAAVARRVVRLRHAVGALVAELRVRRTTVARPLARRA
jgi:CHAD domain-containing protein